MPLPAIDLRRMDSIPRCQLRHSFFSSDGRRNATFTLNSLVHCVLSCTWLFHSFSVLPKFNNLSSFWVPLQNQLEAFTKALRTKLLDRKSGFGKEYLKLLVSEIRIKGNKAEISGSYSALAHAVEETKKHSLERVPSFVPN